jgi:hypothetical protein
MVAVNSKTTGVAETASEELVEVSAGTQAARKIATKIRLGRRRLFLISL